MSKNVFLPIIIILISLFSVVPPPPAAARRPPPPQPPRHRWLAHCLPPRLRRHRPLRLGHRGPALTRLLLLLWLLGAPLLPSLQGQGVKRGRQRQPATALLSHPEIPRLRLLRRLFFAPPLPGGRIRRQGFRQEEGTQGEAGAAGENS